MCNRKTIRMDQNRQANIHKFLFKRHTLNIQKFLKLIFELNEPYSFFNRIFMISNSLVTFYHHGVFTKFRKTQLFSKMYFSFS